MSFIARFLVAGLGEISFANTIIIIVSLIIIWGIVSIPVYIAAKMVAGRKATFLAAMGATLIGPIVYSMTMLIVSFFLAAALNVVSAPLALIVAFIAWLAVYKSAFSTGWFRALLIAILSAIIFSIISLFVVAMLGNTVPGRFFDLMSF